jgi:polysaccharide pyruvyl transferase WcaK-like protein
MDSWHILRNDHWIILGNIIKRYMLIQIDGTSTKNKGAELMLDAILEEIERQYPSAQIIYNSLSKEDIQYKTSLKVLDRPFRLIYGDKLGTIFSRLGLPNRYFTNYFPFSNVDLVLDASGFKFGDQWNHSDAFIKILEDYYRDIKKNGSKIILLPQALGPFNSDSGKKVFSILNKYVDYVFAREAVSFNYMINSGFDKNKIEQSLDFTNLVRGELPIELEWTKSQVCIIPNKKMLTHSSLKQDDYLNSIRAIIDLAKSKGLNSFLLNHEGVGDYNMCVEINKSLDSPVEIVDGLNAKQIKGVISGAYFVFSSRYHGVASSLSQGVPCLATSWSHKYKLLFLDYGLEEMIVNPSAGLSTLLEKVGKCLDPVQNSILRRQIVSSHEVLKARTSTMWKKVWSEFQKA